MGKHIIYNDEDNVPMNDDVFDHYGHNPTVYLDRAEMKAAEEPLPFTDPPEDGCWNCNDYNGDFCTKLWNNLDESYKVTWRDSKKPSDCCEDWSGPNPDAVWEDFFGEDDGNV